MEFIAIDVETANQQLSSICQVAAVSFADGHVAGTWATLVNPEDYFHPLNVSIHGIDEEAVRDAPKLPDVFGHLSGTLAGRIVACHMSFDRVALGRAAERYGLPTINCRWLDSAKVARRAWCEFARAGYGLANLAKKLGITFQHHDASEDARAAGEIILRAIAETGQNLENWLVLSEQPIFPEVGRATTGPGSRVRIATDGSPDGPLAGEVVVFTGALTIPRHEAAAIASHAGCTVAGSVTRATTLLVVGDQDIRKLGGHERSSKRRRAEALAGQGQPIRILAERDFRRLLEIDSVT